MIKKANFGLNIFTAFLLIFFSSRAALADSMVIFLPEVGVVARATDGYSVSGISFFGGFWGLVGPEVILFDSGKTSTDEIESFVGFSIRTPPLLILEDVPFGKQIVASYGLANKDNEAVSAGKIGIRLSEKIEFNEAVFISSLEYAQWFVDSGGGQTIAISLMFGF